MVAFVNTGNTQQDADQNMQTDSENMMEDDTHQTLSDTDEIDNQQSGNNETIEESNTQNDTLQTNDKTTQGTGENMEDNAEENTNSNYTSDSENSEDIIEVQTASSNVQNAEQLIKDVKKLLAQNYIQAKKANNEKAVQLLKTILSKVNKIDPETADEKTIQTLEKFKKILQARLNK